MALFNITKFLFLKEYNSAKGVKCMIQKLFFTSRIFIFFFIFHFFFTTFCLSAPILIYQSSSKDNSFNQGLHNGILKYKEKYNLPCIEVETKTTKLQDYIDAVQQAINKKHSPILLPYSSFFPDMEPIIKNNPQANFIYLDQAVENMPNVLSFSFANEQGGFLAGALAALMTKSQIIGIVYTSNTYPVLMEFCTGFIQGAKYINPSIKIVQGQIGDKASDWKNTSKARIVASQLINQGADVLFATAGLAGLGAFEQASQSGIYAIGADINQNNLYPGTMIGSVLKNNDKVVMIALSLFTSNIRKHQSQRLGLMQNAIAMDFDGVSFDLVPEDIRKKIKNIRLLIIQNKIKIEQKG